MDDFHCVSDRFQQEIRRSKREKRIERTDLITECLQIIQKDNILYVTGKSGFGKSCLCVDVLQKLYFEDDEYEMYILKHPDEWNDEWNEEWKECVDKTPVVFIDDFGRDLDPNECLSEWDLKTKLSLDIKLVIAIDIDVLSLLQGHLNSYNCFATSNILDISSDQWKLSVYEKRKVFDTYFTSPCYKGPSFTATEKEKIVQSDPINGFLKTCHDFFTGELYLSNGSSFLHIIRDRHSRKSRKSYA